MTGSLASSRPAILPSLLPQTSRPLGLVRFSISQALCVRFRQTIHSSPTLLWVFTSTFLLLGLRVRIRSKTGLTDNARTANRGDPLALLCFLLTCSLASLHSLLQSRIAGFTPTNILAVLGQRLVMDFDAVDYGTFITVSSRYQQLHVNDLACPLPGHVAAQSCVSFHVDTSPRHTGDGCLMFTVPAVEVILLSSTMLECRRQLISDLTRSSVTSLSVGVSLTSFIVPDFGIFPSPFNKVQQYWIL